MTKTNRTPASTYASPWIPPRESVIYLHGSLRKFSHKTPIKGSCNQSKSSANESNSMRLFLAIFSCLILSVIARRGQPGKQAHGVGSPQTKQIFMQWGYPYGWGLTVPPSTDDGLSRPEDEVKAVKRGTYPNGHTLA